MTSEEICRILNEQNHDGETDWEYGRRSGLYYSEAQNGKLQNGRIGLFAVLSPASAEIIAQHYKGLEPSL